MTAVPPPPASVPPVTSAVAATRRRSAVLALLAIVANPLVWLSLLLDLNSIPAAYAPEPVPVLGVLHRSTAVFAALVVAGVATAETIGRWPRRLPPAALVAVVAAGVLSLIGVRGQGSLSMVVVLGVAVVWAVATVPTRFLPVAVVAPQLLLIGVYLRWHLPETAATAVITSTMILVGAVIRRIRHRSAADRDAQVRREERLRLARDLHDLVGHELTATVLQTQVARLHADAAGAPESLRSALVDVERQASNALAHVRQAVGALRDEVPPGPLVLDLDSLLAPLEARGITVTLECPVDPAAFDRTFITTLDRALRVAVGNVIQHGRHVRNVRVTLWSTGETVELTVADDGVGGPRPAHDGEGGHGILGLQERATMLGGSCGAGPAAGGGWTLHLSLPAMVRPA